VAEDAQGTKLSGDVQSSPCDSVHGGFQAVVRINTRVTRAHLWLLTTASLSLAALLVRKVAALVAGDLEAEVVKLDFERLAELMRVREYI
jgi:hypothetical protein